MTPMCHQYLSRRSVLSYRAKQALMNICDKETYSGKVIIDLKQVIRVVVGQYVCRPKYMQANIYVGQFYCFFFLFFNAVFSPDLTAFQVLSHWNSHRCQSDSRLGLEFISVFPMFRYDSPPAQAYSTVPTGHVRTTGFSPSCFNAQRGLPRHFSLVKSVTPASTLPSSTTTPFYTYH